jgi:hypothetical protein
MQMNIDLTGQTIIVMQRELADLREQLKQALTAVAKDHAALVDDFHGIASGMTGALKSLDYRLSLLEQQNLPSNGLKPSPEGDDKNIEGQSADNRPGREL